MISAINSTRSDNEEDLKKHREASWVYMDVVFSGYKLQSLECVTCMTNDEVWAETCRVKI